MWGISATGLGMVLRAYGKAKGESAKESYKDLAAIASIGAVIVLVLSFLVLIFGTTAETVLSWLPEMITSLITVTGFWLAIMGAIVAGLGWFLAMFLGALVVDIAIAIKESV